MLDAVVVGSGPNGLAAAVELARAGLAVRVLEARSTPGGGCRTRELTRPGFAHDVCAAVHPLGLGSPFLRSLPLEEHGLAWIQPPLPLAHPLDEGPPVLLRRDAGATAAGLGDDGPAYRSLVEPLLRRWEGLLPDLLGPLGIPRHPLDLARFGRQALRSLQSLAGGFREGRVRALLAGLAAHGILPLDRPGTAALALVLGISGHAYGWPLARGGSQALVDALVAHLRSLGGEVEVDRPVTGVEDLPAARIVLFDLIPRQVVSIAGDRLPTAFRSKLLRFRHGPGVFKLDWALSAPVPWRNPECAEAGTVHLGGTLEEIAAGERTVWGGAPPERPYVLLVQPSLFDPVRALAGRHTAWGYCHVPSGSAADMVDRVERQVERFAPGFRDCVLARSAMPPEAVEAYNPNYPGGDISGGVQDLSQTFARPVSLRRPYTLPVPGWYLCSASTPPGGGVHGMCGYHAARAALRDLG